MMLLVEMASPSMRWVWPLPYKVIELYEVSADPGACVKVRIESGRRCVFLFPG